MSDASGEHESNRQRQPSHDELAALVVRLLEENRQLRAENDRMRAENALLAARIAELETAAQRGQKRSAAPFSKNQPKPNPKRPGRKKGEGKFEFRRAPMPTEPPVIVPMPSACPACGAAEELLQPIATELPTITELPEPQPRVTQYRRPLCRCARCGNEVRGHHADLAPDQIGASAHRFGPRAKAAALVLNGVHGVPVNHVPAIMHTLTGLEMTPSAVTKIAQQAVAEDGPLAAVIDEIAAEIASSPVAHMDGTGWHVASEPAQLVGVEGRNSADEPAVLYDIVPGHNAAHAARLLGISQAVIDAALASEAGVIESPSFTGVLKTDRLPVYDALLLAEIFQDKCTAHLRRSIDAALAKLGPGDDREFGEAIKAALNDAENLHRQWQVGELADAEFDRRVDAVVDRWHDLLTGLPPPAEPLAKLHAGFAKQWHFGRLLNFLQDPRIEPTNNRAERSLRPAVIARKVSQCSRTWRGAKTYARLKTVLETWRRRGRDLLAELTRHLAPNRLAPAR